MSSAKSGIFIGLSTLDIIHHVSTFPERNQKVRATSQYVSAGGPATNAAVTFASLGGDAHLATAVAADAFAALILSDLQTNNVDVINCNTLDEAATTSVSSIIVTEKTGERAVVSINGSNISPIYKDALEPLVQNASVVLWDGYFPQLAEPVLQAARRAGVTTVFDGGSWKGWLKSLFPLIDIAICSADFAVNNNAQEDVLSTLHRLGVAHCCITNGAAPVEFLSNKRRGSVNVTPTKVTDSLGAGDVFHGAFCYYVARHRTLDIQQAIRYAADIASHSITYPGTREWITANQSVLRNDRRTHGNS